MQQQTDSHMVLRSALAHRLQTHVWIRGSASNHYLQTPARLRLQFSSVARSTSFCVLFAALSLTEVTDRDTSFLDTALRPSSGTSRSPLNMLKS